MTTSRSKDASTQRLMLLAGILLISYLCVALPLAVVPIFVTQSLGLAPFWAGLAVGVAFLSTILTRGYAGFVTDRLGPRTALLRGLFFYAAGGLIGLGASLSLPPSLALALLIAGRLILGLGESLAGVGVISWAIAEAGPARSGRVISVLGTSIYAALAIGGPLGLWLFGVIGFSGTMSVASLLPVMGLVSAYMLRGPAPNRSGNVTSFFSVLRQIWMHGLVITAQGVGFAAIGAFFALYFLDRGWANAGLGLTAFGSGFVAVRIFGVNLVDRHGGLPVATVSLAIETVGQFLIWMSNVPSLALLGALLTGCGCSLVFPAIGREVVRLVSEERRGAAVGGFSAFQDLAYGVTGPVAGLLVAQTGIASPFCAGTVIGLVGLALAFGLWRNCRHSKAVSRI